MTLTNLEQQFSLQFGRILGQSLGCYRRFFFPFLLLALITYLPFLLLSNFISFQLFEFMDMIHGSLLDMVVFLAIPTIFMSNRVYPLATLNLFQRFFTSATLLALLQMTLLFIGMSIAFVLNPALMFFGVVPFLYIIFAGHFLIIHNEERMLDIAQNLAESAKTVRKQFFVVFWNYLNISLLLVMPLFTFSLYYVTSHPDMAAFVAKLQVTEDPGMGMQAEVVELALAITQEAQFRYGRLGFYLLFRPLKSIFLAFLFLAVFLRISPERTISFLGLNSAPPSEPPAEAEEPTPPLTQNKD